MLTFACVKRAKARKQTEARAHSPARSHRRQSNSRAHILDRPFDAQITIKSGTTFSTSLSRFSFARRHCGRSALLLLTCPRIITFHFIKIPHTDEDANKTNTSACPCFCSRDIFFFIYLHLIAFYAILYSVGYILCDGAMILVRPKDALPPMHTRRRTLVASRCLEFRYCSRCKWIHYTIHFALIRITHALAHQLCPESYTHAHTSRKQHQQVEEAQP